MSQPANSMPANSKPAVSKPAHRLEPPPRLTPRILARIARDGWWLSQPMRPNASPQRFAPPDRRPGAPPDEPRRL